MVTLTLATAGAMSVKTDHFGIMVVVGMWSGAIIHAEVKQCNWKCLYTTFLTLKRPRKGEHRILCRGTLYPCIIIFMIVHSQDDSDISSFCSQQETKLSIIIIIQSCGMHTKYL